jgi:hypothetical protein
MNMEIEQILTVDLADRTTTEQAKDCPIWQWVRKHASFAHVENNDDMGIYEFIVHRSDLCETRGNNLPGVLKDVAETFTANPGINYTVFYM